MYSRSDHNLHGGGRKENGQIGKRNEGNVMKIVEVAEDIK